MARFDRYMLSQLMVLFGFFSLVLVLVYWVNRAVALFDQLIADGQSATVFLEFTALTLPNVIRLVLPVSAFAAAVYVTNRLASESELVVIQATGYSPARLARPVLVFGLIVGALLSVLTHVLVPASATLLSERSAEISENVTAKLLKEGEFLHSAPGVTFYIREISREGELRDIFLSDARDAGRRVTYTAQRALIVRGETGPKLLMFEGMAQTLDTESQGLSTTRFADFAFDIAALIDAPVGGPRRVNQLTTPELFSTAPELQRETGASAAAMRFEAHQRISQALLAVVAALVGFSALLVGGFSRFGMWRQIIGALVLLILIKSLDSAMADIARRADGLWPVTYLASVVGFALAGALLWIAARPALFRRRDGSVPA